MLRKLIDNTQNDLMTDVSVMRSFSKSLEPENESAQTYILPITAVANSLVLTSFAPSIWRAKS